MAINVGRATKVALAQRNKSIIWLAQELNTSRQNVSVIANRAGAKSQTIDRLADAFELSASEFIALGEFSDTKE